MGTHNLLVRASRINLGERSAALVIRCAEISLTTSGVPRNFVWGGCSTNSVEGKGQREQGSGGGSPLVRGSAQFANEWNPYSY
jgi:hypothetical protein